MATWVKAPDNTYYQISQIIRLYVDKWTVDNGGDGNWWINATLSGSGGAILKGQTATTGFPTQAAAQTYLDQTAIPAIGGSV